RLMTILILVAAFGSVYGVLLGYSRVLYAAAADGQFFSLFARVHRTKRFPSFSVVAMGIASAVACLLSLSALIKSLIVLQILTQFMAQCVGLILIRRYRPDIPRPFSMWLYPLPVLVALLGWLFILLSSGIIYIVAGLASVAIGFAVYLAWARKRREWPFVTVLQRASN
ncbi:MAG: amino acid permease, partial [Acidobacteriaceae bacterium]|nr:amino acid permease [Acidobacteriaceae bacterium]